MYLSTDYILTAIRRLSNVHPFYGITFLSCKKNNLPVGKKVDFPMDSNTRAFLEEVHKISPSSQYYYQPYASNAKKKLWVDKKYPSSGLQAINTQTFSQAFLHVKKEKTWGWTDNYIDVLEALLKNKQRLSIIDLAIWVFKDKEWPDNIDLDTISQHFLSVFDITPEEKNRLFSIEVQGYPIKKPFQEKQTTWVDLSREITPPPDAAPNRGATLSYLELQNVGPTADISIEPNNRLNIITGDNGLGKSFLMECAWWALTGTWADISAQPHKKAEKKKSVITYELASDKGAPSKVDVVFDMKTGQWPRTKKTPSIPGLIVYARVDGSYAVWDPAKQYNVSNAVRKSVFSRSEVWDGITGSIEGLIRDWVKWQSTPEKYPFEILKNVLRRISPPDMGELLPGQPIRIIDDTRDIPTIIHPYGEIPIVNASAGVRRIVTLAYLIVWAWYEHKVSAELTNTKPEKRMVILIDEIEAHLHPKWQRAILPALLDIQTILSSELEIQFLISTHSPLVMASAETFFNAETDKLFHLSANKETGEAELADMDFIKYGHVNSWLTSPIFSLGQARAQEAENAINRAKRIQLQENPDRNEIIETHKMLLKELGETDPFWPRWIYFAEQNGVSI
ncbi:MAG: ATP-binding protein [Candidatus Pelethousia sp.]|nr:ATP-binding protein [Candidatus Pelethousia sp.]